MRELLTQAQKQLSTDVLWWLSKGLAPISGSTAPNTVDGATRENSYYLETSRAIQLPGAVGARADTEPMIAYFESEGWETTVTEDMGDRYSVKANTGEEYRVTYVVKSSGQYNMVVDSELFWGDYSELLRAVTDRIPLEQFKFGESVPGMFIPFPKWSDPVREHDFLNPYPDDVSPTPPGPGHPGAGHGPGPRLGHS